MIQQAEMALEEKASRFKQMRTEMNQMIDQLTSQKPSNQKIIELSQKKFEQVFNVLNQKIRVLETESIQLKQRYAIEKSDLVKAKDEALHEKQELEKGFNELMKKNTELNEFVPKLKDKLQNLEKDLNVSTEKNLVYQEKIQVMETELKKSQALAESATKEKEQVKKRLDKFQEQWEKFEKFSRQT
ncbi:MAG: hypothetical protein HQK77_08015 [Desulfobacterales bacterium]|nr:hypothetical protein [Desulfobacterales bacterium]